MDHSTGHVCARCPRTLGASCCEPRPGEKLVSLTSADIARIREHRRCAAKAFVDEEVLTEEEARAYEDRRILWRGYFRRSTVRFTLKLKSGACVFLDRARGCTLPAEVRPIGCRLYPFDQWPDGSWSVQVGRYGSVEEARKHSDACLAVEEANRMEDLLAAFGLTFEEVEALGAQLQREAREQGQG